MREIGKDFQDVQGLRLCDKVVNFAQNTSSLSMLNTPLSCEKNLADLDDCYQVIQVLEKDKLTDFTLNMVTTDQSQGESVV